MITKAIIETIEPDGYHFKVRIPVLHKIADVPGSTPKKELPKALVNYPPGVRPNFSVGDVVYVAFENNQYSEPVIIGALLNDSYTDKSSSIRADSLEALINVGLPDGDKVLINGTTLFNAIDFSVSNSGGSSDTPVEVGNFDVNVRQLITPFNENEEYEFGRYVIYNNKIYQKKTRLEQKNYISQPYSDGRRYVTNSRVSNGVKFTTNPDGSITAKRVADSTSNSIYYILSTSVSNDLILEPGYYFLSGTPSDASSCRLEVRTNLSSSYDWQDTGNGYSITYQSGVVITYIRIYIPGYAVIPEDGLTFYPQIEKGIEKTFYRQHNDFSEPWIPSHWEEIGDL